MDALDDLTSDSRDELVAAIRAAWGVDVAGAEAILRASEPLWEALEQHGGVDTWGGGEFCRFFPEALMITRRMSNP